jgi:hypothetical protein
VSGQLHYPPSALFGERSQVGRGGEYQNPLRITGGSDFANRPVFYKIENTKFRKPDLFPSSGEGGDACSVGFFRRT